MAGRMHKPCLIEFYGENFELRDRIRQGIDSNRRAALAAALLKCSWSCTENRQVDTLSLLNALVNLSYGGDVRVGLAENPNKVSNIVKSQSAELLSIYEPFAQELDITFEGLDSGEQLQDCPVHYDRSPMGHSRFMNVLPKSFLQKMEAGHNGKTPLSEDNDLFDRTLSSIVRASSLVQSGKGVVTAGPARSARYLLEKVKKRFS
mmetsp:Transcript_47329/g.101930  ORF Transcript_47329/g.101930 Transcript_47329/m.101930 type:complete len:205 (-) Transcript_47329:201-815(-)